MDLPAPPHHLGDLPTVSALGLDLPPPPPLSGLVHDGMPAPPPGKSECRSPASAAYMDSCPLPRVMPTALLRLT